MRENSNTLTQDVMEIGTSIISFIKISKAYLFIVAGISWLFSTYDVKDILTLFVFATALDTLTRIHADSFRKGIPFNPLLKKFWLQIKSSGLKLMGRKIFVEYGIAVLITFCVDILIFKSTLHFNLLTLKLNIPMCSILFFTGIEIWSIFENLEDAGHKNWLKISVRALKDFIPEKWQKVIDVMKSNKK